MLSRKLHRRIGLLMLAPLLAWALSAIVFLIKPGYENAYEILKLKTYPLERSVTIPAASHWQKVHLVQSILGDHLLVQKNNKLFHLSPLTLQEKPLPEASEFKRLLADTLSQNPQRYGEIVKIDKNIAYTSTGIEVELHWNTLTFSQRGRDRKIIDLIYKIHYLQWTPWSMVNNVFSIVGLLFLITLTGLGIKVYFTKR